MGAQDDGRKGLLPFRYLGLAFFLAWNWCLNSRDNLMWDPSINASTTPPSTALIVGPSVVTILAFVTMALTWRRAGDISQRPVLMAMGAAMAAGTGALRVAIGNGLVGGLGFELAFAIGSGASTALLTLAWGGVYARLEPRAVLFFGAASLALCACLSLFLGWVMQPVRSAFAAVLPAASFLLLALSAGYAPMIERPGRDDAVRYRFPWKPVVIMAFAGFIAEFVTVALFSQGTLPPILAELIVGVLTLAAMLALNGKASPSLLMSASVMTLVAALAVLALQGSAAGLVVTILAMISYIGIKFYTYALLAVLCRRQEAPVAWLFGFAAAAAELTSHLGGLIDIFIPNLVLTINDPTQLAVMAAIGLAGLVAAAAIWASERSFKSNWAVDGIDPATGEHVPTERELFTARCEALGGAHGLTGREIEVMGLLAQRHTYTEIAEDLVLSLNTVKSHTHRIYAKLDVHTRDELVAAIGAQQCDG